jgi:hypothetical protein
MQFPQVRPAPVARATSATQRAPFAIDSRMSPSVTTLQWHTYMSSCPSVVPAESPSQRLDPGRYWEVSLT